MSKIMSYKDAVMREANAAAQNNVSKIAETMVPIAKTLSPVLTGKNAESINWDAGQGTPTGDYAKTSKRVGSSGGIIARVFTQSGYGGFLEIGTVFMRARPYLTPAWEIARGKFKGAKGKVSIVDTGLTHNK